MGRPDHVIPRFKKMIGLNKPQSGDSLSRGDWLFSIKDSNGMLCGSAMSYIRLTEPSVLFFGFRSEFDFIVVFFETDSPVECFNNGLPDQLSTKIYISKKALFQNQKNRLAGRDEEDIPVIFIDRSGEIDGGYSVEICGACNVIFNPDFNHEIGGRVWIETDAPVRFIEEKVKVRQ